MSETGYDTICRKVETEGATQAKVVPMDSIVVEPWVQWKCKFGCPRHGKSKNCPPFSPHYEETKKILGSYSVAILIEGQPPSKQFLDMMVKVENELSLSGYYKAFALVAGPCPICEECNTNELCRFPAKARPSMESCGIDVFKTVRNNGFEVDFLEHRGEYVKYFGLVLVE